MTMVKDNRARRQNKLTVVALANLVAVIVDTMRNADVPNGTVMHFIDELEALNNATIYGEAGEFLTFLTGVLRGTVPVND